MSTDKLSSDPLRFDEKPEEEDGWILLEDREDGEVVARDHAAEKGSRVYRGSLPRGSLRQWGIWCRFVAHAMHLLRRGTFVVFDVRSKISPLLPRESMLIPIPCI